MFIDFGQTTLDKLVTMATRKRLFLICEIPNFANAHLGKVTKFHGYHLFHFGVLSNLLASRWKTTSPGMNSVNLPRVNYAKGESRTCRE